MRRLIVAAVAVGLSVAAGAAQTAPAAAGPSGAPAAQPRPEQPPLGHNEWRIDPSHSAAHFSVRHLVVATVRGQLGRVSGIVEYDGRDLRSIKADVTIDVNGITTQNGNRDRHLRSDDFFDVANHPTITFRSKRAEPGTDGRVQLIGDLTIRGTTQEVVLDVEGPTPVVKNARGALVAAATATTKIKRLEYGLKYNNMVEAGPVVGDEVTITIDVEVTRPGPVGT